MALSIDAIRRLIERQMAPTIRRVNLAIARGVIRSLNDAAKAQALQVSLLDDELADDVEHFQPFGLSFVPPTGAEVVALAVGGNRDHLIALGATSRSHRPTGASEGEGGLYTLTGWKVFCDDEGNVFIGADEPGGATFKVALASMVEAEFNAVKATLASGSVANESGTGTTPVVFASPYTGPADLGSSKVKVVG